MTIIRVEPDNRARIHAFNDLPFQLYKDCAIWVPPLRGDLPKRISRDHLFYRPVDGKASDAAFFLCYEGDDVVGRIAAIDHQRYNAYHQSHTAFFQYFDTIDDQSIADQLFDAAFDWARRRGLDSVVGPKGMLRSDGMGILIEGFDHRPAMGVPYNHAYYQGLVENAGFTKEIDYFSGHMEQRDAPEPRLFRMAERIKQRSGFTVRPLRTKKDMAEWAPAIGQVNNEAFTNVWGYYPMSDEELQAVAAQLMQVADPKLIKIVVKTADDGSEDLAGFLLGFPDLSEGIQRAQGRMWPIGWVHILREYKRTKWLTVQGLGMLPQYQGLGATVLLYTELAQVALDHGFTDADVVQVAENNTKSLNEMSKLGVHWYKTHRIYRREI